MSLTTKFTQESFFKLLDSINESVLSSFFSPGIQLSTASDSESDTESEKSDLHEYQAHIVREICFRTERINISQYEQRIEDEL